VKLFLDKPSKPPAKTFVMQKLKIMGFNIVLMEPEIPTNTGNIGRLSLASGSKLHLVKPFGFELSDKRLKRAGLDYWKHLSLSIYESIDAFYAKNQGKKFAYFSSHGARDYCSIDYKDDMFLIFGKESTGLPKKIVEDNAGLVYKIPIYSPHIRSLNLANAVGIVVYEGIRNLKMQ
jgi:tRNA (cytidine/uridine-2'-O-)-methyltransferase